MGALTLDTSTVLIFLFVFLVGYFIFRKKKKLPPGPFQFPLIGNILQLAKHRKQLHLYFQSLGKQYGGLFSLRIGSIQALVLTDNELIKQALIKQSDVFSGRPQYLPLSEMTDAHEGVIFGIGEKWKNLRRVSLVALRDFGVGKKSLEERIQEEARAAIDVLRETNGKPFDHEELLQQAVSNIICSIVFGSRFEYKDSKFQKLIRMINYGFGAQQFGDPADFSAFILRLTKKKLIQTVQDLQKFVREQITEHRDTFDSSNIRDFIDLHIESEAKGEHIKRKTKAPATNLERTILDLFVAGTETTSTTLNWALLYMMRFPEVQRKCQEEIDREVGSGQQAVLADRERCPYVEATLLEVQRLQTIVPLSVPHETSQDTTLAGYDIPKGTFVLVNLHSVHRDPNIWDEPDEFRPDRWLDSDGKIKKNDAFIAFSVGPRACMGEILAKMELFLFFTSMLQQFTFKMEDENNPPPIEGVLGVTLFPRHYKLCAHIR